MGNETSRRAFLRGGAAGAVALSSPACVAWFARWFDSKRFFDMGRGRPTVLKYAPCSPFAFDTSRDFTVELQEMQPDGSYKTVVSNQCDGPNLILDASDFSGRAWCRVMVTNNASTYNGPIEATVSMKAAPS